MRFAVVFALVFVPSLVPVWAQADLAAGARSYEVCAGCHGFLGEGNRLVGAPRLAGIEGWYLTRQIENFRERRRGHAEGDPNGRRMALMAQAVDDERELADVVAWIDTLPPLAAGGEAPDGGVAAASSAGASPASGQTLYATCAACHGIDGRGNEALGAPGLVALDRWYLVEQLRLYAEAMRGTHPDDSLGAQMRALAASFDSDEERQALASFIGALPR